MGEDLDYYLHTLNIYKCSYTIPIYTLFTKKWGKKSEVSQCVKNGK